MADERRLQQQQFQHLAKNPTEDTTIYRMQNGPGESLGVHWTTDQNVAHYTGLGRGEGEQQVHRAVVNPNQIISQGEWMGGNIRSHYTEHGQFKTGKSQWGLDSEAEVRLRPGTTVREHAVAPQGTHEYAPSGREPTIEARGHRDYVDLAHHAVQGTPEANRLHSLQGALPHIQQALFDPVVAQEGERSGQTIGYTPKWDLLRGGTGRMDFHQAIDFSTKDVGRIGKAAGLSEWGAGTESAHEPLLAELRQPAVSQPEPAHRRVANQMQFEGL